MIVSGASVPAAQFSGELSLRPDHRRRPACGRRRLRAQGRGREPPRKRLRDVTIDEPNAEAFLQFARNTVGAATKGYPAPLKCIDAVAAAVAKPFDEGMRIERALFLELVESPESRALRHAFFAERAADPYSRDRGGLRRRGRSSASRSSEPERWAAESP